MNIPAAEKWQGLLFLAIGIWLMAFLDNYTTIPKVRKGDQSKTIEYSGKLPIANSQPIQF